MSTAGLPPFSENRPLRVAMVSKALVTGAYQRKAEEIAALGVELTVFTPPYWRDRRGSQVAETLHTQGYALRTLPTRRIGDYHLHHYPTLGRALAALQPQILHMDEEPYNYATFQALRAARKLGIAATFFTWQNIEKRYPPPFAQMERWIYRHTPVAIAGNREAQAVLRAKGYAGEIAVIPQFGVDTEIFSPAGHIPHAGTLRIGYAGALVHEKGVDGLLNACATLAGAWQLTLVGEGDQLAALQAMADRLGIGGRVRFAGKQPSTAMVDFYRDLDVLVLPSRTMPNWKEQFGRVLVEAMASGVAVVGSDSGEIPRVIGTAGMVYLEHDWRALANILGQLQASPERVADSAARGRTRVLDCYTMHAIARQTVDLYRRMLSMQGAAQ